MNVEALIFISSLSVGYFSDFSHPAYTTRCISQGKGTVCETEQDLSVLRRGTEPGAFSSHCQENPDTHHQSTVFIVYKIPVVGEKEKGGNSINKGRMMYLGDDVVGICRTGYMGTRMAQLRAGIDGQWFFCGLTIKLISREL